MIIILYLVYGMPQPPNTWVRGQVRWYMTRLQSTIEDVYYLHEVPKANTIHVTHECTRIIMYECTPKVNNYAYMCTPTHTHTCAHMSSRLVGFSAPEVGGISFHFPPTFTVSVGYFCRVLCHEVVQHCHHYQPSYCVYDKRIFFL